MIFQKDCQNQNLSKPLKKIKLFKMDCQKKYYPQYKTGKTRDQK